MLKCDINHWVYAAGVRAVKTAAESALGVIGSTLIFSEVDWKVVAGTVALSVISSFLVSLKGLPEVPKVEKQVPNYFE